MKQSPDLQRKLLFDVEDCDNLMGLGFANKAAMRVIMVSEEELADFQDLTKDVEYNLGLLVERGLLRSETMGQFPYYNLTATGHSVLDAIRDEGFWNKLKDITPKEAGALLRNTVGAASTTAALTLLGYI